MIGSRSEAEDVVQEALLRAHRAAPAHVESPAAYLATITTRLAIDHLRSARVRRESHVGPWLPEPIATDPALDAAAHAVLDDTLSMAFLVVLETLSPDERAVLVSAGAGQLIGAVFVEPGEDGGVGLIRGVRNPAKLVGLA
jgi:DNA-directed RNA polymerase specialized sigma24 family protein